MPLLNYTTRVPADKTAGDIITLLRRHGATAVMMEFDEGEVNSISWKTKTLSGELSFRLPANIPAVRMVLERQGVGRKVEEEALGQARRVAWRILKDWVKAQLALLETEMVTLEQLFLPYLRTSTGQTLYDRMATGGLLKDLPASPFFKQLTEGSP